MTFITWDTTLDLHIDIMNNEHRILINHMNHLYQESHGRAEKATIRRILQDFAAYAAKHFLDEERYMAAIDFDDLVVHRSIHQRLLKRVQDYIEEYERSASASVDEEFFNFLKIWVTAHIRGIDAKYATVSPSRVSAGVDAVAATGTNRR